MKASGFQCTGKTCYQDFNSCSQLWEQGPTSTYIERVFALNMISFILKKGYFWRRSPTILMFLMETPTFHQSKNQKNFWKEKREEETKKEMKNLGPCGGNLVIALKYNFNALALWNWIYCFTHEVFAVALSKIIRFGQKSKLKPQKNSVAFKKWKKGKGKKGANYLLEA